jgi:AraC-like DNA-binding protein/ligand-binding sensor protein
MLARLRESDLFRSYRQAFEATTDLPLVLREAGSYLPPLQGSKRANPFCIRMRRMSKTCAACLQLQQRIEEEATHEAKTLQCYAGLSESAVPVRVGKQVVGYLQTGQVFLRAPSRKLFKDVAGALGGGEWEAAYFRTRVVAAKQYESIIRLLAIFAEHLAVVSNQLLISEATVESPVMRKVRRFIVENHGEKLGLRDVARAVNMSPFYFCKIFKSATGLTFTEHLARQRIESAKQMLLNAHTRVSEVAFAAGFQSLSQFNRVFHRIVGEAPSRYRERLHGSDRNSAGRGVLAPAA